MSGSESIPDRGAVVVTGGARGIGEAIVRVLAAEGVPTAILDVDTQSGGSVAEELRQEGRECMFVETDVTNGSSVERAAKSIEQGLGPVHGLVNNAGGFESNASLEEVTLEAWDDGISRNLTSAFLCTRAFLRQLRKTQGSVVNISSLAGRIGLPGISFVYSAAKAGVLGLTRQLAMELAEDAIRVNAVAPGMVGTQRLRRVHGERLGDLEAQVPWGRVADPSEIASTVSFLLGPDAAYVTGATVDVNGGRFAM